MVERDCVLAYLRHPQPRGYGGRFLVGAITRHRGIFALSSSSKECPLRG
jgi:hypothetical protein